MEQGITSQDIITISLFLVFFGAFLIPPLFKRMRRPPSGGAAGAA